jgi:hypothetical protein
VSKGDDQVWYANTFSNKEGKQMNINEIQHKELQQLLDDLRLQPTKVGQAYALQDLLNQKQAALTLLFEVGTFISQHYEEGSKQATTELVQKIAKFLNSTPDGESK